MPRTWARSSTVSWCRFAFFFQAEDGIRDFHVTGVQTCALPISGSDGNNCGTCANVCGAGTACSMGVCGTCAATETQCGNSCVDVNTNRNHCGACDRSEERRVGKGCRSRSAL